MDSVVEKLGFFDFLNHIITGMCTLVGAFFIAYQFEFEPSKSILEFLVNQAEVNSLLLTLSVFSVIAISYVLGMVCYEIYIIISNRNIALKKITEDLFTKNSCVDNPLKRMRYKTLAKEIFDNNGIKYSTNEQSKEIYWTHDLNSYFYGYCVYQIQISGQNKKTENLRDIEGLASSFCVSSFLLFSFLCIMGYYNWYNYSLPIPLCVIEGIIFLATTYVFYKHSNKALRNRIRMTLSLYEVIHDSERKELTETGKYTVSISDSMNLAKKEEYIVSIQPLT